MIIGGCAGSASGGLKVSRVVTVWRIVWNEVEKSFRPRVVRNVRINGKTFDDDDTRGVLSYFALFFLLSGAAMLLFGLFEPNMSLTGCVSAAIACINNIGPGFAEIGPTKNFEFFGDWTKIFAAFLMIMGRIEFYAILALFMPSLWKKFQ